MKERAGRTRRARPAFEVVPLFETPLYVSRGPVRFRPALLQLATDLVKRQPRGASRSNANGWHSRGNLLDEEALVIEPFERMIRSHVNAFIARLSRSRGPFDFDLYAWVNVNGRGASNRLHVHPSSFLSGAYYVDVRRGPRSGNFVVWDPRGPQTIMYGPFFQKFTFPWCTQWRRIDVRAGTTLIFPAWLQHEVTPLEEEAVRVSIAFNVYRKGQAPI